MTMEELQGKRHSEVNIVRERAQMRKTSKMK